MSSANIEPFCLCLRLIIGINIRSLGNVAVISNVWISETVNLEINILSIQVNIILELMPEDFVDGKSILV